MGNTGAASAIKGTDMAAKTASSAKPQGNRKVDDGFQKLLNSKAEEDTGSGRTEDTKKPEAKKDDSKKLQEDQAPKKEKQEAKVEEESTAPVENTLDQVQAAMLFRIDPEAYTEAEMPVIAETVTEEVTAAVPELVQTAPADIPEQLAPQTAAAVSEEIPVQAVTVQEVSGESVQSDVQDVDVPVAAAGGSGRQEEVRQTVKEPARQSTEAPQEAGQQVQAAQPHEYRTEEVPVQTEAPVQTVRVEEPEEIPEKVLDQLLVKTADGQKEFEIQLEPEELGKILIRVAVAKEATTVSIICTEQRTMELMARNARDIGAIMEERLESPTTIVVEEKEPSYLEQRNQQNGGNNAEQEQGQQRQSEKGRDTESSDFLQQLRLGLI